MRTLLLSDILSQTGGNIIKGSGNPRIKNVKKVSKKKIKDNTLLFHLDRDQIKGKYWSKYHSLAIISDVPNMCTDLGANIVLIEVENVEEAYWKFIEYYRNLFTIPVIGVTGTCGKTTTKEMMSQILCEEFNVESTWMSMNSKSVNLRYLTSIDDDTEVAVFEMPVCYPGYLRTACNYFKPEIRILLNIGVHHLADCNTPMEYMLAKAEIVEGLNEMDGTLILNADDENIKKVIDVSSLQKVIYFGKNEEVEFQADHIRYGKGGMDFTLKHQDKIYKVFVPGYGEHNVYNALAAIAAVSLVGVTIPNAIHRLAQFEQVEEHLEFKTGVNGSTVIDDTWNSSPLSMASALDVLKNVTQNKTSIALLGYMPQLGKEEYATHEYEKLGEKVVETGVDLLIIAGEEAIEIGRKALELGMDKNKVHFCKSGTEIYEVLQPYITEQAMILLKITHRVMKRQSYAEFKNKLILEDK